MAAAKQEPKTRRSKRTIPIARSVMRRLEQHVAAHVGSEADALVFTARRGGPLFRSTFAREVSEWAGHNSVAFTLTRYGGLFEDGSEAAVDRLDALLSPAASWAEKRS
jgi:integrase